MIRPYVLERRQVVPADAPDVFGFFSDAANLETITPPFLRFRILTPLPIPMREGARIEYALSLFGVPFRWRTRITRWEPGACFVDEQESGPYAFWRHAHAFEAGAGSTTMRDRVEYALPLGPIGSAVHALFVRNALERIFDYRRDAIARIFSGNASPLTEGAARKRGGEGAG